MKNVMKKIEPIFCIVYLLFAYYAGIKFLIKGYYLFASLTLVLAIGDSFHLFPRIEKSLYGEKKGIEKRLLIGNKITSITMTFFYVILYYVWKSIFKQEIEVSIVYEIVLFLSALIRIIVCLAPYSYWEKNTDNIKFSMWRNIPFIFTGAVVAILFFKSGNTFNLGLYKMGIAIIVSFICYLPVALFSHKNKKLGMLMIPKTIMYMWMIYMILRLV